MEWYNERSKIEPDQTYRRVITKAVLEEKATGKRFVVFNIHTNGEAYGLQEINYALERVLPVLETGIPTYFTGDFNIRRETATYAKLTEHMNDAKLIAKSYVNTISSDYAIIDYIWCSKDNVEVEYFTFLDEQIYPNGYDGKYAADHRAVLATISF